uniref:Uncharacterized protein n=2 Tax=Zea mays TaxID=4577 RepID=A0A804NRZ9_MAIZE
MLNFPSFALCSANFGIAGARPWRSTMLARWAANLARPTSSDPLQPTHRGFVQPSGLPPRWSSHLPQFAAPSDLAVLLSLRVNRCCLLQLK